MLWFHLSVLAAVSKAINQAVTKTLIRDFPVLAIAAYGQLASGLLIFPLIFFPGFIDVPTTLPFHKAATITIIINIVAIILLIEAIKRSDLSYALPFLGLTPVFTVLTGWFLRGEVISVIGSLGILLVFAGTLAIDTLSLKDWLTLGGRRIFKDKGVLMVIFVALIYSIASVYDKTATLLSDPYTYVWYSAVARTIGLMVIYWIMNTRLTEHQNQKGCSPYHLFLFILLGISFNTESIFQMVALQTSYVAYVIAIKRLGILITSLVGMMAYKEKFTWARLTGAGLIIAGAGIIYIA